MKIDGLQLHCQCPERDYPAVFRISVCIVVTNGKYDSKLSFHRANLSWRKSHFHFKNKEIIFHRISAWNTVKQSGFFSKPFQWNVHTTFLAAFFHGIFCAPFFVASKLIYTKVIYVAYYEQERWKDLILISCTVCWCFKWCWPNLPYVFIFLCAKNHDSADVKIANTPETMCT